MVLLNWAKRETALFLAGSQSNFPTYFMIGSGSGTTAITQTALIHAYDRQAVTSTNGSTLYKIKWQGDWNTVEISGLSLTEFGILPSGAGTTGSMWSRSSLPGVTFDGTNELRIEETWEVY